MAGAEELLSEYGRWSQEKVNRDQDLTPRAFLDERRERRAVQAVMDAQQDAATAAPRLREALENEEVSEDLRQPLLFALAVCETVTEAGQWE